MDEMKVKLSTKFMRGIVAKIIARSIRKKYGYKVEIRLNELDISMIDGETKIMTSVEMKLNSDEFKKLMESITED